MKLIVLGTAVLLVGAVSLWMKNAGQPYWWTPLIAMIVAVGVLSSLLLGDKETIFRRVAAAAERTVFSDSRYAVVALLTLLAALSFAGWKAWTTLPAPTDYYSVSVYRGQPQPGQFTVGAEVVLFSDTDGASWIETVPESGTARIEGFTIPTTARINITEIQGGQKRSWASELIKIDKLPDGRDFDLARVPPNDWISQPGPPRTVLPVSYPADWRSQAGRDTMLIGDVALQRLNAPWGLPAAAVVVNRFSYILGVDPERRIPLWLGYAVGEPNAQAKIDRQFRYDPAVPREMQADREEYSRSGFDRGHLVSPREVRYKGVIATTEASYYTVLTPQEPRLNRVTWNNLEKATMRLAEHLGREIYVINGPLFDPAKPERTIGRHNLPGPTDFFRVVAWIDKEDRLRAAGYTMPNVSDLASGFQEHAVPITEIERRSGLTIFPELEPARARVLKSETERLPEFDG